VVDTATTARPYLVRALHEWMSDNGQTPLMIVDAAADGVEVPTDFVEDDRIVMNVSWSATKNLQLDNEFISFEARFSGTPFAVMVPVAAVKGIYARESGQGMMFQDEPAVAAPAEGLSEAGNPDADSGGDKPRSPGRPGGRPSLKVVK